MAKIEDMDLNYNYLVNTLASENLGLVFGILRQAMRFKSFQTNRKNFISFLFPQCYLFKYYPVN